MRDENFENAVTELYRDYGFELEKKYKEDEVLVFGMTGGYFSNVDIVSCSKSSNEQNAKQKYEDAGYTVISRGFRIYEQIEKDLFEGFFHIKRNRIRFNNEYDKFSSSVVSIYGEDTEYKYLNSPYFINDKPGEKDVIEEIYSKLKHEKPVIFLVEAAAGFGKTCTAYEIAKKINEQSENITFLAELSRNRQAKIFKHILLDEIDRVFPSLSSKLVEREIKKGRVITILDGFDELLRDGDAEEEFEGKEPMLETIGHYLRGNAKLVLTTRKTVLFEGDNFFNWIDDNVDNFELVRIRLGEPRISDWLDNNRYRKINSAVGVDIDNISNPVLLSYLRCIKDEVFEELCKKPEELVESYFNFMLEREQKRQELEFSVDEQHQILDIIAYDMVELDYFSEDRNYIIDLILENCTSLIDESIKRYSIESKPTREQIAHKLASHALLDRSTRQPNYIGFINDFVFGNYIARNIISRDEWNYDKWSFLEPAIISYKYRDDAQRELLFKSFENIKPYLSCSNQVSVDLELAGEITINIVDEQIESLVFNRVEIGSNEITNCTFIDCVFKDCKFNYKNIDEVVFLTCQFYNCEINEEVESSKISFFNSHSDNHFIEKTQEKTQNRLIQEEDTSGIYLAERAVLERFWPVGREYITYKHRPIRGICNNYGGQTPFQLFKAIQSLKKKGILLEPQSNLFVEINFDKMVEIKDVLGRI